MKFINPNSKLYSLLSYIATILLINMVALVGIISVVGFSFSLQMSRAYIEGRLNKQFFTQINAKYVLKSMLASVLSYGILISSALNFTFFEGLMRFVYAFVYAFIVYVIILRNMYAEEISQSKMKNSHIMHISMMNYPKFVFFFTIVSAIAYLLGNSKWGFIVIALYLGSLVYLVYLSSKKTIDSIV